MISVYSDRHRLHLPARVLHGGELIPHLDVPERADAIVGALKQGLPGSVRPPEPLETRRLGRVHHPDYLEFLRTAGSLWTAAGRSGPALPYAWRPPRSLGPRPAGIDGLLGWYAADACTPINENTWTVALEAAATAMTGASLLRAGEPVSLAICRPPGHHAGFDYYGGHCYLNNAALAADLLAEDGQVAILDLDYHHGNGTQDIFWSRGDVVYASVHAQPGEAFPYFSGHREEIGAGPGRHANRNFPLAPNACARVWENAFTNALAFVQRFRPRHLVVSLGLDTSAEDPIGTFSLGSDVFARVGKDIAQAGVPTLYVLEGGYSVDALGLHALALLRAHVRARG